MDFTRVFNDVTRHLDQADIRYALIGGFAMALRGVQRATIDLDFILMLDDLKVADKIFIQAGYTKAFKNENVSHYMSPEDTLGRIDILHAFRGPTLSMLERADRIKVSDAHSVPVVQAEDIIGLKIQAIVNSPERATSDWTDIRMILECSKELNRSVDWQLLASYLEIFDMNAKLNILKNWYDPAE